MTQSIEKSFLIDLLTTNNAIFRDLLTFKTINLIPVWHNTHDIKVFLKDDNRWLASTWITYQIFPTIFRDLRLSLNPNFVKCLPVKITATKSLVTSVILAQFASLYKFSSLNKRSVSASRYYVVKLRYNFTINSHTWIVQKRPR